MNGGEQTWVRFDDNGRSMIKQTNTLTGRTYTHPDTEWLFTDKTHMAFGIGTGLTWDTGLVCTDTYKVKIKVYRDLNIATENEIHCPSCGHRPDVVVERAPNQTLQRLETNSADWVKQHKAAVIKVQDKYIEVPIPSRVYDIFNEARRRLEGKPRSVEEYKSHCALLEMKIKRLDKETSTVTEADIASGLKTASFWMDLSDQLKRDTELFDSHWMESRQSSKLYTYGHHGHQRHLATVALDAAQQTGQLKGASALFAGVARAVIASKQ